MFLLTTSHSTKVVRRLTIVTRPHSAAMFAALISVVESVAALTVATTALVAVMDAVPVPFRAQDESVNTFMIPVVLSPQTKRVRNFCAAIFETVEIVPWGFVSKHF